MKNNIAVTERTKLKRISKRGIYSKKAINDILDETFVCHLGFVINNQPYVIPTCYGRKNNKIYFHGSRESRMLKYLQKGSEVCINITIVDGIVLARSAFHHSINYRSVVIFGKPVEIKEPDEKTEALRIITRHIIPGRWNDVRKPNKKELDITSVFSLKLDEVSAKIRTGGPSDEKTDMELNIWAGVLPLTIIPGTPSADSSVNKNITFPQYLLNYKRH